MRGRRRVTRRASFFKGQRGLADFSGFMRHFYGESAATLALRWRDARRQRPPRAGRPLLTAQVASTARRLQSGMMTRC